MTLATSGLTIPPANTLTGTGTPAEQRLLTLAGAGSLVRLTYGRDTIGARLLNVLPLAAGSTTLLVQVLWGYALDAVEELRLNGAALPAGSSVVHYLGSQTAVDADMASAMAAQDISYTQTLEGYAYSVIKLPTRSVGEQIEVTGRLRGRRVYDPRKDSTAGGSGTHRLALPATWEWSECPALCHADFLASTVYGAGEPVDWASAATTANANDALVGGVERRRIIGLSLLQAAPVDDWSETLRAYSGCWLMATAAGIKMVPDADGTAVASYTHAAGQIAALDALEMADLGDAPTVVEVVYTDTSQTPWRDATARVQLSGTGSTRPVRLSRVPLPGIHRHSQAVREATERLNKLNLQSLSTRVELFDEGIAHQRGDIITLTHPAGLSAKPFRVTDVEMLANGQWSLAVTEHSAAVYSESVVTRTSFGDASFVSPAGPPSTPTGLGVSVTAAGNVIRWNANPESDVQAYELRVGGTDWASATPLVGSTPTRVGGTSYVWAPPASAIYTLRLVAFDSEGLQSAAAVLTGFLARTEVRSELGLPLELWQLNGHSLVAVSDGRVGSTAMRLAGISGAYPNQGQLIAIDRAKTYKTRFWARPSSDTVGVLYFSLRQFLTGDINGSVGPVNGGRSPYKPSGWTKAQHETAYGAGAWGEYAYTWSATDWQAGVAFVLPEFLDNHSGAGGHWDVQGFAFYEITDVLAAQEAAQAYAAAQASLADTQARAYADGIVDAEEARAIADATAKANTAQAAAVAAAAIDATNKANAAQSAAQTYAAAQATLADTQARAYADGIVDAEEARAIADATAKANTAQAAAVAAAAIDATNKANAAQSAAQTYAAAQATLADTQARAYADGIVDAEEARAIADAAAKAEAARVAAETAAAADATAKANVAALTATWSGVTGSGKPADNATVGATFGVNVNGQASAVHIAENAATAVYTTTVAGPISAIAGSHTPDGFTWQTEIAKINFPSGPAPDLGSALVIVVVSISGAWEAIGGSFGVHEVRGGLHSGTFDGSRIKTICSANVSETRRGQFTDQTRFTVQANAANSFSCYAKVIAASGASQSLSSLELRVEVIKR